MSFRVTARTVLQLGAELISSDGVAFYELIKNAFDAHSTIVEIEILARIPGDMQRTIRVEMKATESSSGQQVAKTLDLFKTRILSSIDKTAPGSSELESDTKKCKTWKEVSDCLEEANYIRIKDTGEGMSLSDLEDVYLTIGTRSRLKERLKRQQEQSSENGRRPILGEKGIGRLSAMRLGNRLKVITSKAGEKESNELSIDWTRFSNDSDELIESIAVEPKSGAVKETSKLSGTTLVISALTENWSKDKVTAIARQEFSKLTDPFLPTKSFPISIRFNGEIVPIPPLNRILFEHAHAAIYATFHEDVEMHEFVLRGTVDYLLRSRKKTFNIREVDLLSIAGIESVSLLKSLGPFEVQAYWFNRQILKEIEGIGDLKEVRELVAQWAGGLMLYRDGFRVNPYGSPDDDWLELDPKALASAGYKVNRRQIIGKVDVSRKCNPSLIDQTNREGLRDCLEKQVLIRLLQHILAVELRVFLNKVDEEYRTKERLDFDQIEERIDREETEIRHSLQLLRTQYPEVAKDTRIVANVEEAIRRIDSLIEEAKELAETFERRRSEMVNLAGLGLMVEVIAHELNRATLHTISTVVEARKRSLPADLKSVFVTLESQLKTLQKRLRVLDPLSTAGRQRKEHFDLVSWVKEVLDSHAPQFQRHGIRCELKVVPKQTAIQVYAVKGMVVQILENLISNSAYWLKRESNKRSAFIPQITVTIDVRDKTISFEDNGPGIEPERKQEIFQAFVTTKPPREGKGLGLYISQEIARYNGAHLYLSDSPTLHANALNTFVLELEAEPRE